MMNFLEIEKAEKEAFDFLIDSMPESESVKNVSFLDSSKLIDDLERFHRFLSKLETLFQTYSENMKNIDISDVSIHLKDFSKRINLDIEFLKRKK